MTRNDATPAPWTCTPTEDGTYALNPSGVGWLRCSKDETWANARLIAAAPELLAALKRLTEAEVYVDNGSCSCCGGYWPDEHRDDCEGAQALAAIAKAEGRG